MAAPVCCLIISKAATTLILFFLIVTVLPGNVFDHPAVAIKRNKVITNQLRGRITFSLNFTLTFFINNSTVWVKLIFVLAKYILFFFYFLLTISLPSSLRK